MNTALWAQAGVAAAALIAAVAACIVSYQAYKDSYRPILRTIPARNNPHAVILKNIGRGAAVSVLIVERPGDEESRLIGEVDAIEPLGETYGPLHQETARIGRAVAPLSRALVVRGQYRVLYQDVRGEWHETEFSIPDDVERFDVRMMVPRREGIPRWARDHAQVVTFET